LSHLDQLPVASADRGVIHSQRVGGYPMMAELLCAVLFGGLLTMWLMALDVI